jgi:triosephosphate isomerase
MIFVNFKTYTQGTGAKAISLVQILEEVATENSIKIIPVVQAADIYEAVQSTKLEIWVQAIDPIDYGAHTGGVIPEAGAAGTFLNHSENKFESFDELKKANKRAQEVGLKTLIFAGDLEELKKVVELKPTFASYEPPELVGSRETSVAQAKPDIISQAVEITKKHDLPLIVGAGIKSQEDVRKSMELGAVGVAVASDIVASDNPREKLLDLVQGFK